MRDESRSLGAFVTASGTRFRAFCTTTEDCRLRIHGGGGATPRVARLEARGGGYYETEVAGVGEGVLYDYLLDGRELPDPYARFLPQGVHGPAMVVGGRRARPTLGVRPLAEHVLYEVHVGTFTEAGTYRAARERLADVAALGATAVELMPLSAFDGRRGWGYDGVAHFAPHAPYGTPDELRAFVDHAHSLGVAVVLDVVYNHFGPSGNYLSSFSPSYFTSQVASPWGEGPDFRQPAMRRYLLDNAGYWLTQFGFDGLRLDATHAIVDPSPRHILSELAEETARLAPGRLLIAEDDRNEPDLVCRQGLDGVWADDFHHAVHVTLTGERDGYYENYEPGPATIADTINHGWLYRGQTYPASGRARGRPADEVPAHAFVYCLQNHDQVGNRALGERLNLLVSPDAYCAATTLLLFLPMVPLLFMGQEWAASSPFLYFTEHGQELGRAISNGRREEFRRFRAFSDPAARSRIPDPQAEETYLRSRLRWEERQGGAHARVLDLHRALLALRRSDPVLRHASRADLTATAEGPLLRVDRRGQGAWRRLVVNFGQEPVPWAQAAAGSLRLLLRSDGGTEPGPDLPARSAAILAG